MSDEDRDVDIESDDDEDSLQAGSTAHLSQAEKRAHHNALERKRRDHIKESFHGLRDSVPALNGEKGSASRAQILKQATEYIQFMTKKNGSHQNDIEDLRKQNGLLESQVRALEKAKAAGNFAQMSAVQSSILESSAASKKPLTSESASESESDSDARQHSPAKSRRKKLKT